MKREDIERYAQLARIELTDGEAESFTPEITEIVRYVSDVEAITGDAPPEKVVGALFNVMREDTITHEGGMYTEDLLKNAPDRDGQFVRVKKVLEDK